jgi:hypothetical protein
MRFTVYRRALLLTAATVALMSGPAFAADPNNSDIISKVTTNLLTSTANAGAPSNILIETTGQVVVSTTAPAITIDSNNIVTNKGTITNKDTAGAVGIQLNTGFTGALDSTGTIDLTGTGVDKIGINISEPTGGTSTVFTGVALPNATSLLTPATEIVAIYLEPGSSMTIAGDNSTGILLNTNASVAGDIVIGGAISMTPTSTSSTSGGNLLGVNLAGALNGNFDIQSSGSISVVGPAGHAIQITGPISGSFMNFGSISASGTLAPSTNATNPESSSAILIENNILGGFYNGGPNTTNSTTLQAAIAETGSAPAINITVPTTATAAVEIGKLTDPLSDPLAANYSFVNRGNIGGTSLSPNINISGISLSGTQAFNLMFDGNGIFNNGSITATGSTTTAELTPINVEGIIVGQYTNVQEINNLNQTTTGGNISATVTGTSEAIATAIDIQANGSLTTINNTGIISASASSTDLTIANLSAFAIRDETLGGTLTTITNSGQINALVSTLTDGLQIASAIDLEDSVKNVTITNSGSITGSIELGSGDDIVTVASATGQNTPAIIAGDINFGGNSGAGNDTLTIGTGSSAPGIVTGAVQETVGGEVAISVNVNSTLDLKNDGTQTNNGLDLTTNVPVSSLHVFNGGTLGLTLAQVFNVNAAAVFAGPVVVAPTTGTIAIDLGAKMTVTFGSFISSTDLTTTNSQFVLLDTRAGNLTIGDVPSIAADIAGSNIPFLFTGNACTYNVAATPLANQCTGPEPLSTTDSELVLNLAPKTVQQLGLTGFAAKMFPIANIALANDNALGAALIGGVTNAAQAQAAYSAFAPDVTGSQRALAVALTDQASGPVGTRQRALRMYAGQDGEATLWGQEFTERLNVGNQVEAAGYSDSGFGFALGMDAGNPSDGRYGGAFTFYSGDTNEKTPRDTKTTSEWYMFTGYTDWRGKGLFVDSQVNVGYGSIEGKRFFDFGGVDRTADGKRGAALLSGGVTAGVALNAGGTVVMPQISIDALTMREEGYTESNGGATTSTAVDGFDLRVRQEYDNSARIFGGVDVRQDLNFGDFFLQPEARVGYRYDFLNAAEKLKAEFACSEIAGGCNATAFSITGPDPAKGNVVAGASIATTTGAWSIGLNYDYLRGVGNGGGHDSITQAGTITLLGRI